MMVNCLAYILLERISPFSNQGTVFYASSDSKNDLHGDADCSFWSFD